MDIAIMWMWASVDIMYSSQTENKKLNRFDCLIKGMVAIIITLFDVSLREGCHKEEFCKVRYGGDLRMFHWVVSYQWCLTVSFEGLKTGCNATDSVQ